MQSAVEFSALQAGVAPQTITAAGNIASSESFGSTDHVKRVLASAGISSTGSLGIADLPRVMAAAGNITSAGSLASTPYARRVMGATGIASLESFGTDRIARVLGVRGIASAGTIGTPYNTFPRFVTNAGGIASLVALGIANLTGVRTLFPRGIRFESAGFLTPYATEELPGYLLMGQPKAFRSMGMIGVASAETYGTTRLIRQLRNAGGLSSSEAIGALDALRALSPGGIASLGQLSAPAARRILAAAAISSLEAHGKTNTIRILAANGLASTGVIGTPNRSLFLYVSGTASSEAHGTGKAIRRLFPQGVASTTSVPGAFLSYLSYIYAQGFDATGSIGLSKAIRRLFPQGIAGQYLTGAWVVAGGNFPYTITPIGIASLEALGLDRLTRNLGVPGMASQFAFGWWNTARALYHRWPINLVGNPSVETDTAGWDKLFPDTTMTRVNSRADAGQWSLRVTTQGTNTSDGVRYGNTVGHMPVAASQFYTFSAYTAGTFGTENLQLTIDWYTAGGAYIASNAGPSTPQSANWQRLTLTATAPPNAAFADVNILNLDATFQTWFVDAVQFQQGQQATDFQGLNLVGVPDPARVLGTLGVSGAAVVGVADALRALAATGITSGEQHGAQRLTRLLAALGLQGAEQFGSADTIRRLATTGLSHTETFGTTDLLYALSAAGVASGETHATPDTLRVLGAQGVASGLSFGTIHVIGGVPVGEIPQLGTILIGEHSLYMVIAADHALGQIVIADILGE